MSLLALPLLATTYLVPTDAELIERADAIFIGTGISSRVVEIDGNIFTEYQLSVEEPIKGVLLRSQIVTVTEPGGMIGQRARAVPGAPVYDLGATSLVFLERQPGGWRTWGLGIGKFDRVPAGADRTFLLRGLDGHDIFGFDAQGRMHVEQARTETEFLTYVRAAVAGRQQEPNYFASGEVNSSGKFAPDHHSASQPYTIPLGGVGAHWTAPRFSMQINANGVTNADALFDSAIAVWNGNSGIAISRGGPTDRAAGLNDDISVVMFNASIPGGFPGFTDIYGSPGVVTSADIRIAPGGTSVLAHEVGHALGFRHSDCNEGTPCASIALMQRSNPGSTLRAWDRLAISAVYGNGPQCPSGFITGQPQNQTINPGSTTNLFVTVTAEQINPTQYQWYQGARGNTSTPVGGNSSNLSVTPPASGTSYWVRVTNGCGTTQDSDAAIVTLSACTQPAITTQPQSQSIQSGQTATFSAAASGTAPLTYQWQEQGLFGFSAAPGVNNGTSYTTPPLTQTNAYRVVVSNSCGQATSNVVNASVGGTACVAPTIISQPASLTIQSGQSAVFSVAAAGTAPFTYEWFLGQPGDVSVPLGVGDSYNTGAITTPRTVWVRVSNACGTVNSVAATAFIGCALAAPQISTPPTAPSNTSYVVNITTVPGAVAYEVESATDPSFATPAVSRVTTTSPTFFQVVAPPNPVAYYFRARGLVLCSGVETPTAWSGTSRTVVIPPLEPIPAPLDGFELAVPVGTTTPLQFQYILLPPEGTTNPAFSATVDVPFLSVSPSQGTVPPAGVILTVTAQVAELPEGTTTGTVIVTFTFDKMFAPNATTTVSTPVSVSSVSAATPVPKSTMPPDNAMIIPAVAHAQGIGALFVSDVRIANTFNQPLRYRLSYTPSDRNATQVGQQTTVTVGAGATTALNDIVKQWFGVGAVPGEGGKGVLEIRPENYNFKLDEDARSAYTTVATSRTYAKTPGGTFGQFIPGIPFSRFVGKTTDPNSPTTLSLQQIAQSAAYRTNLGLVEASGQPATVRIGVYSSDGTPLGQFDESLQAGEYKQFDQYLASKGITLNDGRLQIDVTSDTGRITAYASVLDNVTADPMLVEATRVLQTRSRRFVIPGIADARGGGANWQSDVRVFNPTSGPISFNMTYYPQGNPAGAVTRQRTANPGQVVVLNNILQSEFGASGAGAVHIDTANESPLIVTARTYDQRPSGTYGQFIPAVTAADAVGSGERPLQVLQVEHSDRFRTNLGLAEVSGQPVQVRITASIPQRATSPVITRTLQANEFVQLNGVLPNFMGVNAAAYNVKLSVEVVGGSGRVAGYASVIDNETQDPTYIPAQ